jgi:Na+/melibiose symporter-like transporter
MKKFCKTALVKSAIYFTIATIIFSLLVLFGNSGADQIALDPQRVLCIYPFCLIFGIANTLVVNKNIDGAVRWIVHAVLTVCGAFLFLILPAGLEGSSGNFMGFALILFIYGIGILFYALITKRVRAAIAEDKKLTKRK